MDLALPLGEPELSPRAITITANPRFASARLAGLRVASNNEIRANDRDRGAAKNRANDIQGAFGEIVALFEAERHWPAASVGHTAMDWEGAVDDVDLVVRDGSAELRLEA